MSNSPQVVLDTNVIYSGLRSRRGASFKLLSLLGSGRFEIHLSVPLVLEYEEVLQEKRQDLGLTEADVDDVLDYLCQVAGLHEIHFLWRPRLIKSTLLCKALFLSGRLKSSIRGF